MSARITLLAAASTSATAGAAFPADEPLDLRGRAGAAELAGTFARPGRVLCSPARVARETAAALSLDPVETAPLLADLDAGRWAGRTLDDVAAAEPEGVGRWLADPDVAPHGGESVARTIERASEWLASLRGTCWRSPTPPWSGRCCSTCSARPRTASGGSTSPR